MTTSETPYTGEGTGLRRSLGLWHVVLYGLGVTIGAGIYVLIGPAAARAGMSAPIAFVIAAIVMGLTAASFAELGTRLPVAAGEAAYINAGFRSPVLGLIAGLLIIAIATVSAAAISVGSAGYIRIFLDLPQPLILTLVVVAMAGIAAWGIEESVTFAAIMTLIEIGGLLLIVGMGLWSEPDLAARLPEAMPAATPGALSGLASATLLAVFAFIGFESIANVAEEIRDPRRTLPSAILLTLVITTLLYMLVIWVALVSLGPGELGTSSAPLADVFGRLSGRSPHIMSAIAIVATLNGIIVQMIMSSRILYGLSRQGRLPAAFGRVSARTQTPLLGTAVTAGAVLVLALALPLDRLADLSSRITLVLFALVNLALVAIKWREAKPPDDIFRTWTWVPAAGAVACLATLVADLIV